MMESTPSPYLCLLFVATAGQQGVALGADEEEIVLLVYVVLDLANNKVSQHGRRCQVNNLLAKDRPAFRPRVRRKQPPGSVAERRTKRQRRRPSTFRSVPHGAVLLSASFLTLHTHAYLRESLSCGLASKNYPQD